MTHARVRLLAVSIAALACACSTPRMKYEPGAPVTDPPAAHYRLSVEPVVDQTRVPTHEDEKAAGHLMFNFATYDGPSAWLSPAHLQDVIVSDLSASALFASVERGASTPADVRLTPVLTQAWATMGGIMGDTWDFALKVDAEKDGKSVLSKSYERKWKTGALGMSPERAAEDIRDVMEELRKDLTSALSLSVPSAERPRLGVRPR